MNYLVAKLKDRTPTIWRVMSQLRDFFRMPDLLNTHQFTPNYKLEEDEWFRIEDFSTLHYFNPLVGVAFNSAAYVQLPEHRYTDISYLCAKQADFLLFQKLGAAQLVRKNWFAVSNAPQLMLDSPIIVLHDDPDAVYDINIDVLYFKDFSKLKGMFNGIEELYREATHVEVDAFLQNNFLAVQPYFTVGDVKSANRKRIAVAMATMQGFSQQEKNQLFSYVRGYCPQVPVNGAAFVIGSEDHLKQVLYGIEERYFTTAIKGERRLANSIQTLT